MVTDYLFDSMEQTTVLKSKYANKLGLSWNRGLGDKYGLTTEEKCIYKDECAPWTFYDVAQPRIYDIHYKTYQNNI